MPEPTPEPMRPPPLLDGSDRDRVAAALGPHPMTVDDLARALAIDARALRVILMELELAGRLTRHGQGLISLAASEAGAVP